MTSKMMSIVTCALVVVTLMDSRSFVQATLDGCTFNASTDRGIAKCVDPHCSQAIEQHIKHELDAAFQYLYMAAYFDDEANSRPGMAKFMYESASEERSHAIMMLEYMNRRGLPYSADYEMDTTKIAEIQSKFTGQFGVMEALEKALEMEMTVTVAVNDVIHHCDADYDGADYFTANILSEQFDGQRKLSGAISALKDLRSGEPRPYNFADFVFDQRMLKSGM